MSRPEDTGQRPDCPHAPHDFSCGPRHDGICALTHQGPCEAVHPICPACFTAHPDVVVSSIALLVERDGFRDVNCGTCERITFHYDAELFCRVCTWLVPDANEKLAQRYAANNGEFEPEPGTCPDCRQSEAGPPLAFPITCPGCGASHMIDQRDVSTTTALRVLCDCRYTITVPPDIWCPGCHLNLRTLRKITALVKTANEPQEQKLGENVKQSPVDRVALRVVELATAGERRSRTLTHEQQRLMLRAAHLDMLLFNEGQIADWILDQVRLRSLGHRLHRDGGMRLMQVVAGRAAALDRGTLRLVEFVWDGIGEWQK